MSDIPQQMLKMLLPVAEALGEELLDHVAFVGGSQRPTIFKDNEYSTTNHQAGRKIHR
jgi:hypothetical protein